jgi:hypothetical protein
MSDKHEQTQPRDPSQGEAGTQRTGEGSDSALSAMLKKRRQKSAPPEQESDPTRDELGSGG